MTKGKFEQLNENYRKIGVKANIIGGFMGPMMSMITRVNYAIVVILGASIVLTGRMDVAKLITYINFSKSYGTPIMQVASCYSSLISALAGYGFARLKFKGSDVLFFVMILTMMVPPQVNIVPLFYLMSKLGWINTYQGLIIPGIFGGF